MLHTIQEAMKLAGVSRRTLYNHSDAGRISYSVGPDGRRYFETAELERVYGKLAMPAHSGAQQIAQSFTLPADHTELAQLLEKVVERAQAPLLARIASMEETLRRLEYKPEPEPTEKPAPAPGQAPGALWAHHAPPPKSIADILAGWE